MPPLPHTMRVLLASLCLAIVPLSGVARAGDGHSAAAVSPDEQAKSRAQPIFSRGLELLKQERWAEGLEAFTEAYAILPSPILRFNIGYCQRALGQYVAALDTLRRFLSEPAVGIAATRRAEAEGYVKELEARVARLQVMVPAELRTDGPPMEVMLDGRPVALDERGSFRAVLDPGRHTVQARRAGYAPRFHDRDLRPGEEARVEVTLEPLAARLQVASNVLHAEVLLDGNRVGIAPWDAEVAAGRHRVTVAAPGYFAHVSELNLERGGHSRVTANLIEIPPQPTPIYRRWWLWAGVGVAVAGAATLTYFLTRPEPQPPPYQSGSLNWVVGGP